MYEFNKNGTIKIIDKQYVIEFIYEKLFNKTNVEMSRTKINVIENKI